MFKRLSAACAIGLRLGSVRMDWTITNKTPVKAKQHRCSTATQYALLRSTSTVGIQASIGDDGTFA